MKKISDRSAKIHGASQDQDYINEARIATMIPEITYSTPVAILSIRLACIVLLTSFFRNQFNHTVKARLMSNTKAVTKNVMTVPMTVFPIPMVKIEVRWKLVW